MYGQAHGFCSQLWLPTILVLPQNEKQNSSTLRQWMEINQRSLKRSQFPGMEKSSFRHLPDIPSRAAVSHP
jgi:hypothetical protein